MGADTAEARLRYSSTSMLNDCELVKSDLSVNDSTFFLLCIY